MPQRGFLWMLIGRVGAEDDPAKLLYVSLSVQHHVACSLSAATKYLKLAMNLFEEWYEMF